MHLQVREIVSASNCRVGPGSQRFQAGPEHGYTLGRYPFARTFGVFVVRVHSVMMQSAHSTKPTKTAVALRIREVASPRRKICTSWPASASRGLGQTMPTPAVASPSWNRDERRVASLPKTVRRF